jgi:hypothetical protein
VPRRARFSLVADLGSRHVAPRYDLRCSYDDALYFHVAGKRHLCHSILFYSLVGITVLVAMIIGMIQLLSVVANYSSGPFWDDGSNVGDHFDVIGGGICGAFVVFSAASVLLYRPWRRRYDRRSRFGVEAEAIHIK